MSFETEGASFPSKYQQIRWIVSRQLMEPTLSKTRLRMKNSAGNKCTWHAKSSGSVAVCKCLKIGMILITA